MILFFFNINSQQGKKINKYIDDVKLLPRIGCKTSKSKRKYVIKNPKIKYEKLNYCFEI